MKKRLISIVTMVAMLASMLSMGVVTVSAADPDPIVFTKTLIKADASASGIPDRIKLEAYTTGSASHQSTDIPTDIIMVLDQSGSMDDEIPAEQSLR